MKSYVKVESGELSRLRKRALAALGLGAVAASCRSASDADGLVMAPMLETAPSSTAAAGDAGREAGSATRPLIEPHGPQGQNCSRDLSCVPPLPLSPSLP